MEGVAAASAIIAIADAGVKLGGALLQYGREARDAPARIKRVGNVIATTSGQLKAVGELIQSNPRRKLLSDFSLRDAQRCADECGQIIRTLRITLCKHGWMQEADDLDTELDLTIFSAFQWPFIKTKLDAPQADLDRIKLDLNLILTTASVLQASTPEQKAARSEGIPELLKDREWAARKAEKLKARSQRMADGQNRSYTTLQYSSDENSDDERRLNDFVAFRKRQLVEREEQRRREEAAFLAAEEAKKAKEAEEQRQKAKEEFKEELRQERQESEARQKKLKDHLKDELRKLKLSPEQIDSIAENVNLGIGEDAEAFKLAAYVGIRPDPSNGTSIDDEASLKADSTSTRKSSSFIPWRRTKRLRNGDSVSLSSQSVGGVSLMSGLVNSGMQLAAWTLDLTTSHAVELGHPQEWLRHYLIDNLEKDGSSGVRMLSQRCSQLSAQSWKTLSGFIREKNQEEPQNLQLHWVLLYVDHAKMSSRASIFSSKTRASPSLEVILGRQDNRGPSWFYTDPSDGKPPGSSTLKHHQEDPSERSVTPAFTTPVAPASVEVPPPAQAGLPIGVPSTEPRLASHNLNDTQNPTIQTDIDNASKANAPTKSSLKALPAQPGSRIEQPKVSFQDSAPSKGEGRSSSPSRYDTRSRRQSQYLEHVPHYGPLGTQSKPSGYSDTSPYRLPYPYETATHPSRQYGVPLQPPIGPYPEYPFRSDPYGPPVAYTMTPYSSYPAPPLPPLYSDEEADYWDYPPPRAPTAIPPPPPSSDPFRSRAARSRSSQPFSSYYRDPADREGYRKTLNRSRGFAPAPQVNIYQDIADDPSIARRSREDSSQGRRPVRPRPARADSVSDEEDYRSRPHSGSGRPRYYREDDALSSSSYDSRGTHRKKLKEELRDKEQQVLNEKFRNEKEIWRKDLEARELRQKEEELQTLREQSRNSGPRSRADMTSERAAYNRGDDPGNSYRSLSPGIGRAGSDLRDEFQRLEKRRKKMEEDAINAEYRGDFLTADRLRRHNIPYIGAEMYQLEAQMQEAQSVRSHARDVSAPLRAERGRGGIGNYPPIQRRNSRSRPGRYSERDWAMIPASITRQNTLQSVMEEFPGDTSGGDSDRRADRPLSQHIQPKPALTDNEIILEALQKYTTFQSGNLHSRAPESGKRKHHDLKGGTSLNQRKDRLRSRNASERRNRLQKDKTVPDLDEDSIYTTSDASSGKAVSGRRRSTSGRKTGNARANNVHYVEGDDIIEVIEEISDEYSNKGSLSSIRSSEDNDSGTNPRNNAKALSDSGYSIRTVSTTELQSAPTNYEDRKDDKGDEASKAVGKDTKHQAGHSTRRETNNVIENDVDTGSLMKEKKQTRKQAAGAREQEADDKSATAQINNENDDWSIPPRKTSKKKSKAKSAGFAEIDLEEAGPKLDLSFGDTKGGVKSDSAGRFSDWNSEWGNGWGFETKSQQKKKGKSGFSFDFGDLDDVSGGKRKEETTGNDDAKEKDDEWLEWGFTAKDKKTKKKGKLAADTGEAEDEWTTFRTQGTKKDKKKGALKETEAAGQVESETKKDNEVVDANELDDDWGGWGVSSKKKDKKKKKQDIAEETGTAKASVPDEKTKKQQNEEMKAVHEDKAPKPAVDASEPEPEPEPKPESIRMKVDPSAKLEFSGDMEGRTINVLPAGRDGMAELVIGRREGSVYGGGPRANSNPTAVPTPPRPSRRSTNGENTNNGHERSTLGPSRSRTATVEDLDEDAEDELYE
ncbi:MAG: hypothetical protein M1820_004567 [Bogoriella megaspora]|nr:MAG: hypothetical protein M1820_004567 [Bogoriella megaspora]